MNIDREPSAFWKAKGGFVPHLVSIMDSNLVVYQASFQNADNVIGKYILKNYPYAIYFRNIFSLDFVRSSLPVNLIPEFTDITIDEFLNAWSADNCVRALVMQPASPLRLRYALIALEYRSHINFG